MRNILNPFYVTGFIDAEGCFHISIINNNELKTGKSVRARFQISLNKKDKTLLEQINNFFSVGKVIDRGDDVFYYQISTVKDLMLVINHFEKYPLISEKHADFLLFKDVLEIIKREEHLTMEGLKKILSFKATLNNGLPGSLKADFPDVIPVLRPLVNSPQSLDPNWVSGFADGEGCFFINIYKKKESVLGEGVNLVFKITQDKRNNELLTSFVEFFGCGGVYNQSPAGNVKDFIVKKFSDLTQKIIPFFETFPLQGAKSKEFEDFKEAAELMKLKSHLTREGLEQIRAIKSRMNFKRKDI